MRSLYPTLSQSMEYNRIGVVSDWLKEEVNMAAPTLKLPRFAIISCFFGVLLLAGAHGQHAALSSYQDVFDSLTSGAQVQMVLDAGACGFDVIESQTVVVSMAIDVWQWFNINGDPRIAFSDTFLTPRPSPTPLFVKLTGGLLSTGEFTFTVQMIDLPFWAVIENYEFSCFIGEGVEFILPEPSEQRFSLTTFNEVKAALTVGTSVTRVANYTNCGNPPPFPTVSGGAVTLHYNIEEGSMDESIKVIDTVLVANMAEGSPFAINSNHMNLLANDSIKVNPAMWDTVEWDNDYFRPDGYMCEVGRDSIQFLAQESVAERQELSTLADMVDALQSGYMLQYRVFVDQCTSSFSFQPMNAVLNGVTDYWQYVEDQSADKKTITFESHHYTESGLFHLEEFTITQQGTADESVTVLITQTDPATQVIMAEETLTCQLGTSAIFSREGLAEPEQLTDFQQLETSLTEGQRFTIVTDLQQCSDPDFEKETWIGMSANQPVLMKGPEVDDQIFTTNHRYSQMLSSTIINSCIFNIFAEGNTLLTSSAYETVGFTEVSGGPKEHLCSLHNGVSGALKVFVT